MAVTVVTAAYGGALCGMHCWAAVPLDNKIEEPGYWGTLPSAWDHPEPNYLVSAAIGEFWSVVTTIPVAGALLMYEGLKYRYGAKVLCIYSLTCGMYSLAFIAHLTLQKLVFSTTVVAVMSNALLTFAQFSYIVHKRLRSMAVRGLIVLVAEVALVGTVATLPYALQAHGGVWTLFAVQSPGVFLATALAAGLAWQAREPHERATYGLVCTAGSLLSAAMALSLVECLIGFEHGFLSSCWGFPWLHIAIHIFEQVGIYLFGVGVAALHTLLLNPASRPGAEVRSVGRWLVYLYCPHLPGPSAPTAPTRAAASVRDEKTDAGGERLQLEAEGNEPQPGSETPVVAGPLTAAPARGRPAAAASEAGLMRRSRIKSPGVVARALQPPAM